MSRPARILAWSLGVLAALAVAAVAAAWFALRASLPQLEGKAELPGLGARHRLDHDLTLATTCEIRK